MSRPGIGWEDLQILDRLADCWGVKRFAAGTLALGVAVLACGAAPASTAPRLPSGVHIQRSAHGGHLVSVDPQAPVRLSAVIAGTHLGDRATTQTLCRRTAHCVVAINGDFFGPRDPLGPVVVNQRLLRSGSSAHDALTVQPEAAPSGAAGALRVSLNIPAVGTLSVPVNTPPTNGVSLYTPIAATVTLRAGQVALLCRVTGRDASVATLGSTGRLVPEKLVTRGSLIPRAGTALLVASASDAAKLRTWWKIRKHGGRISYPSAQARDVLGGFPQLISRGRLTFDPAHPPDDGLHSRTAIGGDDKGHLWLLVIDQPVHISVPAQILLGHGARWAMNLDGGGSSTMATASGLLNRPSHGQRKVASALVIVSAPAPARPRTQPAPVAAPVAPVPVVPAPVVVVPPVPPTPTPTPQRVVPVEAAPRPPPGRHAASAVEVACAALAASVALQLALRRRRKTVDSPGTLEG